MAKLSEFFEELQGGFSSYRLAFYSVLIVVFSVWSYISVTSTTLADVPESIQWILGILITGKVIGRGLEGYEATKEIEIAATEAKKS